MNSKKLTAQCAVLQGSYWVAVCAINGFATVFLLHIGLKSSQIGVVLALGNQGNEHHRKRQTSNSHNCQTVIPADQNSQK